MERVMHKTIATFVLFAMVFVFLPFSKAFSALSVVIDNFSYPDTATAASTWIAKVESPSVRMENSGSWGNDAVMVLPCDYSIVASRCYWDRAATLDLSAQERVSLRIYVGNATAVGTFTLYLQSGSGWYSGSTQITKNGWQLIEINKSDFAEKNTPAGWSGITNIRFSAWKNNDAPAGENIIAVQKLWAHSEHQTIDDFSYSDNLSAQAAWENKLLTPPVEMSSSGLWGNALVMKMPCGASLIGTQTRCYWDKSVTLDLRDNQQISLNIYIDDPLPIRDVTLHLYHASGVWYSVTKKVDKAGWQTISMPVSKLNNAGARMPLDNLAEIARIRLSLWLDLSESGATFFAIKELFGTTPTVSILDNGIKKHITQIQTALDRYAIDNTVITQQTVEDGLLLGSKILIIPQLSESSLSSVSLDNIETFVRDEGGKIVSLLTLLD